MKGENSQQMTAGYFLKQARERAKKTQRQIGNELAVSVQCVSQWETNDRNVPRSKVHEVASSYELTEQEKSEFIDSWMEKGVPTEQAPSEYKIFYGLMMLPKEARERVIKAVKAYESIEKE